MAIGKLGARLRRGFEDELRMREGVIADDVSCLRYRARNFGALLDEAADHEKRRSHAVLGQHIEQLQRMRIVWAVVVGQGDLLASTDSTSECSSVPLTCRRHGLVACGRGSSGSGRESNESGKHERIVNASQKLEVRLQK